MSGKNQTMKMLMLLLILLFIFESTFQMIFLIWWYRWLINVYALQKGQFQNTNKKELEVLFELHIAMGLLKFPGTCLYWGKSLGVALFMNSMPRYRFFKLRSYLHMINNMEIYPTDTNTFKKVRPLINVFVNRCRELSIEEIMRWWTSYSIQKPPLG